MTLVRTVRSACSRSSHHSARYLTLLPCCLAKKMIRLVAVSPCHRTSSCKVTRLVTVQGDSFPLSAEAVPVLQRETAPPGHTPPPYCCPYPCPYCTLPLLTTAVDNRHLTLPRARHPRRGAWAHPPYAATHAAAASTPPNVPSSSCRSRKNPAAPAGSTPAATAASSPPYAAHAPSPSSGGPSSGCGGSLLLSLGKPSAQSDQAAVQDTGRTMLQSHARMLMLLVRGARHSRSAWVESSLIVGHSRVSLRYVVERGVSSAEPTPIWLHVHVLVFCKCGDHSGLRQCHGYDACWVSHRKTLFPAQEPHRRPWSPRLDRWRQQDFFTPGPPPLRHTQAGQ